MQKKEARKEIESVEIEGDADGCWKEKYNSPNIDTT